MSSRCHLRIGARRGRTAGNLAGPFITWCRKCTSSTPAFTRMCIVVVAMVSVRAPHEFTFVDIDVRDDECSSGPSAICSTGTGSKVGLFVMGVIVAAAPPVGNVHGKVQRT